MHTNQLINSQSPYLLQHAHNPVNWFMWSDEIILKAQQENKPILLSIGYSSCHWCHVMERESFEDETVAAIMNENFINIKVDREERPDLDHIYMDALQTMTGSGGWPLNIFLTPQLKPFYGGTYFPPKTTHGRMSWSDTLLAVYKAYTDRRDEIELQAEKLTEHIKNSNSFSKLKHNNGNTFSENDLNIICDNILKNADTVWGGFGAAPKFPQTYSIQFLLRHYHFTKNEEALTQALLSLDKMILGGIYDHVGGGFARYGTDEKWFAPHFEKMLYDNALIIGVLCEAYQITNKFLYKQIIEQTLAFIEREMMSNEYGFYSALDADSEGVEGKYYTWSRQEIVEILKEDAEVFCKLYQVEDDGNWEETNILWLNKIIEEFADENGFDKTTFRNRIELCKQKLLAVRDERIRPLLDDKILCSWNALMNIAYCKAFVATGNMHYKEIAERNMSFLLKKVYGEKVLFHCYKNSLAYNDAYADDYAYLINSLIHLQEITGNLEYISIAKQMMDKVVENFNDNKSLFFTYTNNQQKNIIAEKVEVYDGATPSANAILCKCLQYLSVVFQDEKLRNRYQAILNNLRSAIIQYPTSFGAWAEVLQNEINGINEIVVLCDDISAVALSIKKYYKPNTVLILSNQENEIIPITKGKKKQSQVTIYLCKNQTCFPAFNSIENFLSFL